MPLTKDKVQEALKVAHGKRDELRDQLNACMGFIQACEMFLAEADKPDKPAPAVQPEVSIDGVYVDVGGGVLKKQVPAA